MLLSCGRWFCLSFLFLLVIHVFTPCATYTQTFEKDFSRSRRSVHADVEHSVQKRLANSECKSQNFDVSKLNSGRNKVCSFFCETLCVCVVFFYFDWCDFMQVKVNMIFVLCLWEWGGDHHVQILENEKQSVGKLYEVMIFEISGLNCCTISDVVSIDCLCKFFDGSSLAGTLASCCLDRLCFIATSWLQAVMLVEGRT